MTDEQKAELAIALVIGLIAAISAILLPRLKDFIRSGI